MVELLQRIQQHNDPIAEKLIRSIITIAFKNNVDWTRITDGQLTINSERA